MNCDDVRTKLTPYLDGELEGDRGSAIRGHLRGCDACRAIAHDEGLLRDGLRALPPLEPPSSLWAGVQRQLAEAEVADAKKPSWRRALARWAPMAPRFGLAAAALAVAIGVLVWRHNQNTATVPVVAKHDVVTPPPPAPVAAATCTVPGITPTLPGDVTSELAAEPARVTASYAETADRLVKVALEQRSAWPDDRKSVFDTKLTGLRHDVDVADECRARQKAYRTMIRYLQRVTAQDDVAFADVRRPQ